MKRFLRIFWRSSERQFIYSRWTFLVLINALVPFLFSLTLNMSTSLLLGIALALASFIIIYAEVESSLLSKYHTKLAKQLKLSAAIKVAVCLLPFIDLLTGSIAINLSSWLTGLNLSENSHSRSMSNITIDMSDVAAGYITTMLDGFLLSMIVAFILLIINAIQNLRHRQ